MQGTLGQSVQRRYPADPEVTTDQALQSYVTELKNRYLKRSPPLNKVCFDDKQTTLHRALGLHTKVSRVQGGRLKAKQELRVSSLFKQTPPEFLRMVVVHELAHLRESDHNKAFYQLCCHMEPDYHQLEFDLRLYLAARDLDQLG
ncbi:MAG: M48 family metallopeptidase [Polyangiaceae bacterium]|nr:M48 family metallopeptidase [Polyangiaceae bacterium]